MRLSDFAELQTFEIEFSNKTHVAPRGYAKIVCRASFFHTILSFKLYHIALKL